MKRSEIIQKTDFSMFSIDKEHWKRRAKIWHENVEGQMRQIDDALEFLRWYLDEGDNECPFSKDALNRIAHNLVALACEGTDADPSEIRQDYRALFRLANYSQFGGLMTAELVKLIDYVAEEMCYESKKSQ